jgi:hypothetical protein
MRAMNATNAPLKIRGASISEWLAKDGNCWKVVATVVIFGAAVICAFVFRWGEWPPNRGIEWRAWKTEPTEQTDHSILNILLAQNREEVRFWQGVLFNVSLVFIAGILGIVSLALKATALSEGLRWIYAIGVVFLCAFYLTFVDVAENAIALNHRDLTAVEIALKLATPGAYIQDEIIYDHTEKNQKTRKGESFVKRLVWGSMSLGLLAVAALFFLPAAPQKPVGAIPNAGNNPL